MASEMDSLRESLFAQMRLPPLPQYSGNTVILRSCQTLSEPYLTVGQHEFDFKAV